MAMSASDSACERLRIRFRGVVQGVGFRPFLHGLATCHGVCGFVLNDADGVLAEIEGSALDGFLAAVQQQRPPLARIDGMDITRLPLARQPGFAIRDSAGAARGQARIGADAATCAACLAELFDPSSRFYLYPFVTCTNCGPRFTITRRLPYDRPNTSMAGFPRCVDCARDYADPHGRRFHAETCACPACGPRLSHAVADIAAALDDGKIVALKGLGGFHLLCDATDEVTVQLLRRRKRRPDKPLAVMVANLAGAAQIGEPSATEAALLRAGSRPIVMVRAGAGLAPSVAPALDRVGLMLPSAPVHHLLLHALATRSPARSRRPLAVVATSANLSGDPLVIDDAEALQALAGIADLIVTHDRPILARADDSVMAVLDGAPAFIRRARGFVPEPIDLGQDGPAVLAVGAQLKATLCVTRGREAFVSQHVGDLATVGTLRFYRETARQLLAMLDVAPRRVVCDLHPDYASTRFAEATAWPLLRVQHHAAHLAAVAAEHQLRGSVLGVALDGHGHGEDAAAWGGELMLLNGARWRRCGGPSSSRPGCCRPRRRRWRRDGRR